MDWTVVEELIPDQLIDVAKVRDDLSSKLGLKNFLEFLYKYRYEDYESTSFESCTSSNIDRNIIPLKQSTIFAELFLKLIYKDWLSKVEKMNRFIEEHNNKNPKRIKIFT